MSYTLSHSPQKTSKFLHPEKTKPHFHTPLTPSHRTRCVLFWRRLCVWVFVVQVVVALLNARADANAVDSDGSTALTWAASNGHDKVRGGAHSGVREGFKSTHTHNMPLEEREGGRGGEEGG